MDVSFFFSQNSKVLNTPLQPLKVNIKKSLNFVETASQGVLYSNCSENVKTHKKNDQLLSQFNLLREQWLKKLQYDKTNERKFL